VGTALAESLLDDGYRVTGVDVAENRWSDLINERTIVTDLRLESNLNKLPESVDLVVHLAANARVHKLVTDPSKAKENFETTYNILEYARDIGADIIFSSSREV